MRRRFFDQFRPEDWRVFHGGLVVTLILALRQVGLELLRGNTWA